HPLRFSSPFRPPCPNVKTQELTGIQTTVSRQSIAHPSDSCHAIAPSVGVIRAVNVLVAATSATSCAQLVEQASVIHLAQFVSLVYTVPPPLIPFCSALVKFLTVSLLTCNLPTLTRPFFSSRSPGFDVFDLATMMFCAPFTS